MRTRIAMGLTFGGLLAAAALLLLTARGTPAGEQKPADRPEPGRFHVRGYEEEGTTTTPFDMVVLNHISRYHLCIEALLRARRAPVGGETLVEHCEDMLRRHHAYVVEHLEDMPEVRDWRWSR